MSETAQTSPESAQPNAPLIVVGVDGSEQSIAALKHAARLAGLLDARIEAVTTWTYPVAMSPYAFTVEPSFEDIARQVLDEALQDAYGESRPSALTTVVQHGHAAQVLIDRSREAEMLVVGSRGRGGFTGLLLGSVSSECASHASCPVLIVR